ncbi:hypothetical protein [Psychrobacter raelei]|uniref:hypothetical protein n=1 Tax=Psychrobacter raelei TaxID=2565531 RepID=UPI003F5FD75A
MDLTTQLSDAQIAFLDELINFILEDWRIDKQDYGFYKSRIEKWQKQGYYDDAMLYFWYYEPIEGLNSKQADNIYAFIKVINGLGFSYPSTEQALTANTFKYIKRIKVSKSIEEKTEAILIFWQSIDYGEAVNVSDFYRKFNLMRDKNQIIEDDDWNKFDKDGFEKSYQYILTQCKLWEAQYPKGILSIYEQLIYKGETVESQVSAIEYQSETEILIEPQYDENILERSKKTSKLKKLFNWIKRFQ